MIFLGSALSLLLCFLLIPRFRLMGAAAATAVAILLESTLLFVVTKRRLGLHFFIYRGLEATPTSGSAPAAPPQAAPP